MSDFLSSGRLEDHPFATLAGCIFREGRTGALTLESGDRGRVAWFLGGNPVAVVSENPQDHLSRFLLEHGRISEEDAQRLAALPETREGLGAADFLQKDTLNWGVKFRFVNLCYDLFRWEEGDYAFHEGTPPKELFLLKVPAHSLIFKGVGYLGRATLVDLVPDEAVFAAGPVAADEAKYLGPDERRLADECRPGRTVAEVLGAGWDDADQVRQLIYALVCLGLVVLTRRDTPAIAPPPADEEPEFDLQEPGDESPAESFELPPEPSESPVAAYEAPPEPFAHPVEPQGSERMSSQGSGAFSFPDEGRREEPGFELPPFDKELEEPQVAFTGFDKEFSPGKEPGEPTGGQPVPAAAGKKPSKAGGRLPRIPRLVGIILGALFGFGVVGGAAWWLMIGGTPPQQNISPQIKKKSAPAPTPPAAPSPAPAPAPTPAGAPVSTAPAPQVPPVTPPPAAPPVSAPPPATAPAAVQPSPTTPPATPPGATAGQVSDRYRKGLDAFRSGDLEGAAAIWESILTGEHRDSFTILLMTACQPQTIQNAQRLLADQEIYLVTRQVNGRGCFRVCLGTYPSHETAARALAGLSGEFRSAGAAVRPVATVLTRER